MRDTMTDFDTSLYLLFATKYNKYFWRNPQYSYGLEENHKNFTVNLKRKIITSIKVGKILKGSLDLIPSPSPSVILQARKFAWGVKAKHCRALLTSFWKQKNCWHQPRALPILSSSAMAGLQWRRGRFFDIYFSICVIL